MGTDTQWRCQSSESGAALMPHDRVANGRRLLLSLVAVLFVMGGPSCGDPAETEGLQIEVWELRAQLDALSERVASMAMTPVTAVPTTVPIRVLSPSTVAPSPSTTSVPIPSTSVSASTAVSAAPRLLRSPTLEEPLRVMVVGDSVTFEVEPGLTAALEHTGLVISANRTQVGFGLSQWPIYFWWEIWPPFLAEVRPEAVVVQTGTWDVYDVWGGEGRIPEPDDPNWEESFAFLVRMANDVLAGDGAHVYWLTMLPSPNPGWPERLNRLLIDVATTDDRMSVVDLTSGFTDADGGYTSHVDRLGVEWPIRKIDGVHLCREGAEVAAKIAASRILTDAGLALVPGWEDGPWRSDSRYDVDPCDDPAPAGETS